MTDAELVKACGERVMGWRHVTEPPLAEGTFGINVLGLCVPTGACEDDWVSWNPLTDNDDSALVLDKMAADGVDYQLEIRHFAHGAKMTWCGFWGNGKEGGCSLPEVSPESRRRVVVLAALRAVGAVGAVGGEEG